MAGEILRHHAGVLDEFPDRLRTGGRGAGEEGGDSGDQGDGKGWRVSDPLRYQENDQFVL